MNATKLLDEIFGEGSTEAADSATEAARQKAAHYAAKPYTPAQVLKTWKLFRATTGNLSVEMSELTGIGWARMDPPDRITVASDPEDWGRLHVYRRWLIDRTPDGDIGAWIYVPNVPESAPAPELHVFND